MQSDVRLPVGGATLPAVFTVPAGNGPAPALVMIYEAFGMSDEMRRIARQLAADGYATIMPDLYARGRVKPLCIAATMRAALTGSGRALEDLEAARRWLLERSEVDPQRIGTVGFCMGGSFALLLARTGLYRVSAPFYNAKPVDLPRSCPVVASYGGRDRTSAGTAEPLRRRLEELGVPHDVHVHPEAGHSFMTRTPGVRGAALRHSPVHGQFHGPSAEAAYQRVLTFFREHL